MRHVFCSVIAGLVLAAGLAACAGSAEPADSADSLLAHFDALTLTEAQAEYRNLDRAARVELWHAQLTRHLDRGGLTAAQDAALRDLRDHLEDALGPARDAYEARLRQVMTEAEMHRFVGVLGDERPVAPTAVEAPRPPGGERVGQASEALVSPTCNALWICDSGCTCHADKFTPYSCSQTACSSRCTATDIGCGFLFGSGCTLWWSTQQVDSCD